MPFPDPFESIRSQHLQDNQTLARETAQTSLTADDLAMAPVLRERVGDIVGRMPDAELRTTVIEHQIQHINKGTRDKLANAGNNWLKGYVTGQLQLDFEGAELPDAFWRSGDIYVPLRHVGPVEFETLRLYAEQRQASHQGVIDGVHKVLTVGQPYFASGVQFPTAWREIYLRAHNPDARHA